MSVSARAQVWSRARSILCVRLDTLGDVLMTGPALRALGGARRRITLLTSPLGAEVARLMPEIDEVIEYEAPWMKATAPRANSDREYEMIDALRAHRFDAAVIFTVYSQNPLPAAFACYLAGIPLRLAHCHENPYQLLTDWVRDPEPHAEIRHEVRRQLDLVAAVGARAEHERLAVDVPVSARREVAHLLRLHALGDRRWAIVHPGASAPSRRYPLEGFAAVAQALAERGLRIVVTGSTPERALVDEVTERVPDAIPVCGLDLPALTALIEAAPLLVSNNTGPVHLAAAVGTPVVDLYALTNPQHTPWEVPARVLFHDVDCKFCYSSVCPEGHHNCLRLVAPATVVEAALELLAERAPMRSATRDA